MFSDFHKRGFEMNQKQKKKMYRKRRIAVLLFLLLCIGAVVWGIRSCSSPSAEPSAEETLDPNYQFVEKTASDVHCGDMILVNNWTPYTFPENNALKSVFDLKNNDYQVKDRELLLNEQIMPALNQMTADFRNEKGSNDLIVISGYRTKEYQAGLLQQRIKEEGAEKAAKWVAQPGHSEHHTGYALDVGLYTRSGKGESYTGQGKYSWINENCWKYGFIVRYPSDKTDLTGILYEPWHFRYLGIPHAAVIREKGFCMEEYIDYLRQFPFSGEHLQTSAEGKNYEIYFVQAEENGTKVPVPKDKAYDLSGNNVDGFIVTVTL